jgi:single-strand DNA-binding protein
MGYQKITIIGRCGKDPETRYSQGGMAICKFSVAVSEKNKKGETTEWFRCVTFDKLAEIAAKYVEKGNEIFLEGRQQTEKYNDKDGNEKTAVSLIVDKLVLIGGRNNGAGKPAPSRIEDAPTASDEFDTDLPF